MAPRRGRDTAADAQQSFEQLYRGHRGDVYRAALRALGNAHDAEDVTQAAFVDAYRAVLRGTRPEAPRAWLLAIAENVRRRRFRTSLRRPREEPLDADAALAAEESQEQAGALLEALGSLTDEQRTAFLLREIAGLSYDEIATRTGSTVGSVQMLLFRARSTLRNELEPPQVHPLLVPIATLFHRFEGVGLAPRAVGAVGAAAVAVGIGSSVPAKADPEPVAPKAGPKVTRSARPVAASVDRPPRLVPAPSALKPQPARAARPPIPVVPSAPAAAPAAATATPAPVAPAPVPRPPAPQTALPADVLELPTGAPPLPVVPVEAAPLVDALVEGAGAAVAAGAGAPPLPELPLDPLPPDP